MESRRANDTGWMYYGWAVVAACFIALMSTSGAQTSFGLLFKPMLLELGWDRA